MKRTDAPSVEEILHLIGLARRAGGVAAGSAATKDAVKTGRARLVFVADDAAPGQVEKVIRQLRQGVVPHLTLASRAGLGAAVGQPPLTAVALTDRGFASRILDRLESGSKDGAIESAQDLRVC